MSYILFGSKENNNYGLLWVSLSIDLYRQNFEFAVNNKT